MQRQNLDWFRKYSGAFMCPNTISNCFKFDIYSLYRLLSYCWETARQSFTQNFYVHPVGKKLCVGSKNDTFPNGLDVLYHHAKFGCDRTTHAGCRCESVCFSVCLFYCHARLFRRSVHSRGQFEQALSRFSLSILMLFSRFYRKG